MTPKERREAQIELIDMAIQVEQRYLEERYGSDAKRLQRAAFLRAVAAELDRVPEEQ